MEKFIIYGGQKLFGKLEICPAKNSFLPILAASLLSGDEVILKNCPNFLDIKNMIKILNFLNIQTNFQSKKLHINAKNAQNGFISHNLTKDIRASIFMLGPLVSKFGFAKIAYPGGCDIGLRPIDIHLKGLKELGVKIVEKHGYILCDGKNMKSANINLDYPSVGATENLMMAAVLTKGTTKITNSAKEPEIVDLQNFLNVMGAKISGAGTDTITIEGVKSLNGAVYTPIPDRIICGTVLIACAMCGGRVTINNCISNHFLSLIHKLQKSGCKIDIKNDKITIESSGKLNSVGLIETLPYPGFPTDLQAQMLAMQTISQGYTIIKENLFETRFKFASELTKMGANIKVNGQTAFVCGTKKLQGADVYASDLRGGAALVLAGLCAEGYTTVHNIYHIDRGYENLEILFSALGAKIQRQSEE